jgi:hypothetical protein
MVTFHFNRFDSSSRATVIPGSGDEVNSANS